MIDSEFFLVYSIWNLIENHVKKLLIGTCTEKLSTRALVRRCHAHHGNMPFPGSHKLRALFLMLVAFQNEIRRKIWAEWIGKNNFWRRVSVLQSKSPQGLRCQKTKGTKMLSSQVLIRFRITKLGMAWLSMRLVSKFTSTLNPPVTWYSIQQVEILAPPDYPARWRHIFVIMTHNFWHTNCQK